MSDIQQQGQPAILITGLDKSKDGLAVASKLILQGFTVIAVCCPGSKLDISAAAETGCVVIEAKKGNAIRAGLEYFHNGLDSLPGVVLYEVGSGYTVDDVLRAAEALEANPGKLIIASRYGNKSLGMLAGLERWLAAMAFTLVHGRKILDPWASLKAVPSRFVQGFLELKGESRTFEFNTLLNLHHMGIKAVNVPVSLEYAFEDGSGLWERAIDILKTMILPMKFVSASLAATLADYTVFVIVGYILTQNELLLTTVIGRFAGAVTGYFLNRNVVFKHKNDNWKMEIKPAIKYTVLATINCIIAMTVMDYLNKTYGMYAIVTKILVDIVLFTSNYLIQKNFIFSRKPPIGK